MHVFSPKKLDLSVELRSAGRGFEFPLSLSFSGNWLSFGKFESVPFSLPMSAADALTFAYASKPSFKLKR